MTTVVSSPSTTVRESSTGYTWQPSAPESLRVKQMVGLSWEALSWLKSLAMMIAYYSWTALITCKDSLLHQAQKSFMCYENQTPHIGIPYRLLRQPEKKPPLWPHAGENILRYYTMSWQNFRYRHPIKIADCYNFWQLVPQHSFISKLKISSKLQCFIICFLFFLKQVKYSTLLFLNMTVKVIFWNLHFDRKKK